MNSTILEVLNLKKHYKQRRGIFSAVTGKGNLIRAVDGVSFYIKESETMGLVGETGCGKTTIGRTVLKLTPATAGKIIFDNTDITHMSAGQFRPYRKQLQMIFQDLDAALNPKMRIKHILNEALTVHGRPSDSELAHRIQDLLEMVNLKKTKLTSYPNELSGGEKRRVGIARTLAVGARLIVADEPTSALDVSIQAQIVNLLKDLQKELGLSYLFISHDLRLVELISHKVAVMYRGQIVEVGLAGRIANMPRHPYTAVLWASLVDKKSEEILKAEVNSGTDEWGRDPERQYSGCRFAPRCPVYHAKGRPTICTDSDASLQLQKIDRAHQVRCHFPLYPAPAKLLNSAGRP
ncbi:MAG: ATP-binding cassette domain-containing protein [Desulfobacterales bacterium]|nr:ATP-binding cassette domain-containing protein [Desulfobacterales bacterium]